MITVNSIVITGFTRRVRTHIVTSSAFIQFLIHFFAIIVHNNAQQNNEESTNHRLIKVFT